MADTSQSHLEKMGRELKCPICLSLLNEAVSLTCNHVFCNLCIVQSMKSGSDCPVCKVPYGRREVRPAPHMDNLVSIYKSMEDASGINIFVTQNAPPTKSSDKEKQAEGDHDHGGQETGRTSHMIPENQRRLRAKGSKNLSNSTLHNTTSINPVKPSFPNKKRVQVPQFPLPETPTQPAKFEREIGESTREEPRNSSKSLYEQMNKKGEPVFSPFFWLRDDKDIEKLTQQTDSDMNTPPIAPSFSDIKDSDDEMLSDMSPKGGLHGESHVADVFDSEMFEWTQRACSPELCSTPTKMQVEDTDENYQVQVNDIEAASQVRNTSQESIGGDKMSEKLGDGHGNADVGLPNLTSARTQNGNAQNRIKKSNKRGKRASKKTIDKFSKGKTGRVLGTCVDPKEVNEMQELTGQNNSNCLDLEKKDAKLTKIAGRDFSVAEPTVGNILPLSVVTKPLRQKDRNLTKDSPAFLSIKKCSGKELNAKSEGSILEIKPQNQIDFSSKSKNIRRGSLKDKSLEEVYITENHKKQDMDPKLPTPIAQNKKLSNVFKQPKKRLHDREIQSATKLKSGRDLRSSKKLKVSFDDISKDRLLDSIHCMPAAKDTQPVEKVQNDCDAKVQEESSVAEKGLPITTGAVLRKCESVTNKFQCAFCHSAEDSEGSGDMVHYFNGRPVANDHNKGSDVIHAHRNCTEWAPNVYFEDDIVKNLKAEIARSRRITCNCCGIKGASLGCYEKSCRKSFHVPCAKLMPECQWDTENFVILCPLHSSSKLPSELPGSQGKRKRKCIPKGQSQRQQEQVSSEHLDQKKVSSKNGRTPSWHWNSRGLPDKIILCCSALTVAEKEIVSKFEKVSGVTELKKWSPSVTHVIASTDENGACRRTLKILMGILEGKWILSVDWIKACVKALKPVDEDQYEISLDVHGIRNGPRIGRLRVTNKEPKLFDRLKFYFAGDFEPSYKGYLQDLVTAAGGIVLLRKPVSVDQEAVLSGSSRQSTFVIYSLELPDKCKPSKKKLILKSRKSDAEDLASSTGAKLASNSWILNSIAACKLQNMDE